MVCQLSFKFPSPHDFSFELHSSFHCRVLPRPYSYAPSVRITSLYRCIPFPAFHQSPRVHCVSEHEKHLLDWIVARISPSADLVDLWSLTSFNKGPTITSWSVVSHPQFFRRPRDVVHVSLHVARWTSLISRVSAVPHVLGLKEGSCMFPKLFLASLTAGKNLNAA